MMADTDAEEETVGGEEHEGGYGESESEHEDD